MRRRDNQPTASQRFRTCQRGYTLLGAAMVGAASPIASASNRYWDVSTTNSTVGGSGTYTSVDTTLFSSSSGGSSPLIKAATTDDILFAGAAGAVTVDGAWTAKSFQFNVTGYTIGSAGTPSSTVRSLSGPVTLGNNVTLRISNGLGLAGLFSGGTNSALQVGSTTASADSSLRVNLDGGMSIAPAVPITITSNLGYAGFIATSGTNTIYATITNNQAAATTLLGASGASSTLYVDGLISGTAGVTFGASGTLGGGAGMIVLQQPNTYAGPTTIINSYAASASNQSGVVRLDVSDALPTTTALTFGSASASGAGNAAGTLNLNGRNQTVASLATYNAATLANGITNTSAAVSTLTINGAQGVNTTFNGKIGTLVGSNLGTTNNNIALVLGASHNGSLSLKGVNTYSGGTIINGGSLRANNDSGSATGSGAITINNGGLLGGSGATGNGVRPLTVNTGGVITAGSATNVTGSLGTGSQKWNAGGVYLWKIKSGNNNPATDAAAAAVSGTNGPGGSWDKITMTALDLSDLGEVKKFTIRLRSYSGGTTPGAIGNFDAALPARFLIASITGGFTRPAASLFTLDTADFMSRNSLAASGKFSLSFGAGSGNATAIYMNYSPAPEPTTTVMFGTAAVGLLTLRRRPGCIKD